MHKIPPPPPKKKEKKKEKKKKRKKKKKEKKKKEEGVVQTPHSPTETMFLIFVSNVSIKTLICCPSPHSKHVKIMFIFMTGYFKDLFFHFYFLN